MLVVILIVILVRKPKDNSAQVAQISSEQNVRMENINANMQNLTNVSNVQLQNMNQQLNNVYQSIGKIQSMSNDVEKLRSVLANVKQRGVFAEAQLKNLLEQTIPGMYEENVKPNPRSDKNVEFAIKIPNGVDGGIT